MILNDPGLFREAVLVGGDWIAPDSKTGIAVTNPATGEIIGHVPNLGARETRAAIAGAKQAQRVWAARTAKERLDMLRRWFSPMVEHKEDLGRILTLEQGKPPREAVAEILYGASFVEWFAEEARRVYGDTIPGHQPDKRILVLKQYFVSRKPWNTGWWASIQASSLPPRRPSEASSDPASAVRARATASRTS